MGRIRSFRVAVSAAGLIALSIAGLPAVAVADQQVDQEQLIQEGWISTAMDSQHFQTFTAGLTGLMEKIQLSGQRSTRCDPEMNLVVEVRSVSDSVPSSTVLASEAFAPSDVPTEFAWFDVVFSSPPTVSAGTQYAIVFRNETPANECSFLDVAGYDWIGAQGGEGDPYPGGRHGQSFDGGTSWGYCPDCQHDQTFRTFVTTPDTTPPSTEITDKRVRGDDATVKFESDEEGSTFACSIDGRAYRACTSPKTYRNLSDGKHRFRVIATDSAGNADLTPARTRFTVHGAQPTRPRPPVPGHP